MKFVLVVFLCLFFSLDAFTQEEEKNDNKSDVAIEELILKRDDGSGKPGETTDKFITTDVPIHFFIQLDSSKPTTVKMNLIAVKAEGQKPETKIVTVSYTTKENQNQVNFHASPEVVWAAGTFRVDVYLDGKFAKSQSFEIEKSSKEMKKESLIPPKILAPRKITKKRKS